MKEYEESFHVLVKQPFLRSMISTASIERAYNQVLGKLSKYRKMNPKFAFEIITDNHFMISMAQEENEEKQEEKLENKFVDIANEYQNKSEILEQKLIKSQSEIESMKSRIKEFELHFSSLDDQIKESNEQIKNLNINLKEKEDEKIKSEKKITGLRESIEIEKQRNNNISEEFIWEQ